LSSNHRAGEYFLAVKVETFEEEIQKAIATYEKYVVCLGYTPEEFAQGVRRLVAQALKVFENREPGLRHGFALNEFVTVIISQSETDRPYCGIYFNLFSPYTAQLRRKAKEQSSSSEPTAPTE